MVPHVARALWIDTGSRAERLEAAVAREGRARAWTSAGVAALRRTAGSLVDQTRNRCEVVGQRGGEPFFAELIDLGRFSRGELSAGRPFQEVNPASSGLQRASSGPCM